MQMVIIWACRLHTTLSGHLFINTSDKMGCKMQSDVGKKRVKVSVMTGGSIGSHAEGN